MAGDTTLPENVVVLLPRPVQVKDDEALIAPATVLAVVPLVVTLTTGAVITLEALITKPPKVVAVSAAVSTLPFKVMVLAARASMLNAVVAFTTPVLVKVTAPVPKVVRLKVGAVIPPFKVVAPVLVVVRLKTEVALTAAELGS